MLPVSRLSGDKKILVTLTFLWYLFPGAGVIACAENATWEEAEEDAWLSILDILPQGETPRIHVLRGTEEALCWLLLSGLFFIMIFVGLTLFVTRR